MRRGRGGEPGAVRLASLGSCQAITYRFWAEQLGIAVDSVTVRAEGDLDLRGFFGVDETVRPGFTAIRLDVTVTGPESPDRYAELAAAVDEHCPVLDLFRNPVPVTRTLADAAGQALRPRPDRTGAAIGAWLVHDHRRTARYPPR